MESAEHGAAPTTDHGDFRLPSRIPGRLEAVLDAIDAAFAEGWSDPGGIDIARRDLSAAAMFLGRLGTELMPQEAKALGRLGLMLHPQARRRARRNGHGECVPPSEQDASLWDSQMIDEAEGLLRAPVRWGLRDRREGAQPTSIAAAPAGPIGMQGCSFMTRSWCSATRQDRYQSALAVAEMQGPDAALETMRHVAADPRLSEYQPHWAARADLMAKTGAQGEARDAYALAIGLGRDPAVRRFLQRRLSALPS